MALLAQWISAWTVCYVWSTIFMLLRLYLRWKKQTLHRTDILAAFTLVLSTITYALSIFCGYLILGQSGKFLHENQIAMSFFFLNLSVTLIVPLAKGCVVLLLQEVETNIFWRRSLWTIHILLGLQVIGILIMNFFGCVQVVPGIVWSILVKTHYVTEAANQLDQRSCIPRQQYIIVNGTLNAFFEVLILICAFSLILRVKVTTAQRIGLGMTFSLGLFTIAVSIVSTVLLYRAHADWRDRINPYRAGAVFYKSGIWSCFEVYFNLTIASILPIRATLLAFCDEFTRYTSRCLHPKDRSRQSSASEEEPEETNFEEVLVSHADIQLGLEDEKLTV